MPYQTVNILQKILELYFPPEMALQRAFYALGCFLTLTPLAEMNENQRRLPNQQPVTEWENDIELGCNLALKPEEYHPEIEWDGERPEEDAMDNLHEDLIGIS